MSYILDALRKSEHERQMGAGQSVGMLYPIEIERNRKPWLIPALLAFTALIAFVLIWQLWLRPVVSVPSNTAGKPAITVDSQPESIPEVTLPEPESRPEKLAPGKTSNTTNLSAPPAAPRPNAVSEAALAKPEAKFEAPNSEHAQNKIRIPSPAKTPQTQLTHSESPPGATAAPNKAVSVDPLADLPALSITGYVHDEQSGNLAMINNQLVREGQEISPGLRLVKILDDSAIFSYKGYVFSR